MSLAEATIFKYAFKFGIQIAIETLGEPLAALIKISPFFA